MNETLRAEFEMVFAHSLAPYIDELYVTVDSIIIPTVDDEYELVFSYLERTLENDNTFHFVLRELDYDDGKLPNRLEDLVTHLPIGYFTGTVESPYDDEWLYTPHLENCTIYNPYDDSDERGITIPRLHWD